MKIAFIGQKGIPVISGGVERRVEEVAVRMAREGHKVFVYARKNYTSQNPTFYKGVNMIYLGEIPTKTLSAISHTFLAIAHALFQNYDVIHFQAPGPSSLCWIIKMLKPQTVLVATFNSRDSQHQKWGSFAKKYLVLGEWVMSKFPDATIAVSDILQKYIQERYNRKAYLIRNGAFVQKRGDSKLIKKWNLEKANYFLSASRLVRHKGIQYLIKAFKKIQKEKLIPTDFKLVIAGAGAFTDDYVKELHALAAGNENIIFTGNQSGDVLASLYQNAFAFVQPSEAEGLSNALLEAMGYGLCPIVSDIEENLSPLGESGIVFENKNANDLAEKLSLAFSQKDFVREKGLAARARVEKEYSWEENARKTLKLYEKILADKKRNPLFPRLKSFFKKANNFLSRN